ncbi:MAG TPA: hypothetical protein VF142_05490 [Longimicrobium sp.]
MRNEQAPTGSLNDIPRSVLFRWMMKAAVLGLFLGVAAGIAALQAG